MATTRNSDSFNRSSIYYRLHGFVVLRSCNIILKPTVVACHKDPYYDTVGYVHDDVIKWKHFRVTDPLGGEFTGHRWIPLKKSVTWRFDVFFDLRLNKRLNKHSNRWWFERHRSHYDVTIMSYWPLLELLYWCTVFPLSNVTYLEIRRSNVVMTWQGCGGTRVVTPAKATRRHVPLSIFWWTPRAILHDNVRNWKRFPHYCPFMKGIHRLPVDSLYKDQLDKTRPPAFWDTPHRPMTTHTSDSHQIPSQDKTKSKLQIKKKCQKFNFKIWQETLRMTYHLKFLDKMYKYEMVPTRTVCATKRTRDAGRTDRGADGRKDGRTDGVKPF